MKNKKVLAMAIASGVLSTGIIAASGPAFAAIDFASATWTVGGINYEFENDGGSDAYMGSLEYMTTATQSTYVANYASEFYVENGDVASDYPYCYGATATESTDAATGDVTITCAATAWEDGSDLYASGSTRFYSDHPMARNVWTFENRGTTDIDLGDPYFYEYFNEYSKGASSQDATSCAALTNDDHWSITSGDSDTMILGYAWQAQGANAFDQAGEDCTSDLIYNYINDTVIPAGKTVHFMNFQYSAAPETDSTESMDAAYAALLPTMDMFNALDDTLCRGLAGETIYGWGTCAASLPDTGVSSAQAGALAAGAGALALTGLALVVIRRRRNA